MSRPRSCFIRAIFSPGYRSAVLNWPACLFQPLLLRLDFSKLTLPWSSFIDLQDEEKEKRNEKERKNRSNLLGRWTREHSKFPTLERSVKLRKLLSGDCPGDRRDKKFSDEVSPRERKKKNGVGRREVEGAGRDRGGKTLWGLCCSRLWQRLWPASRLCFVTLRAIVTVFLSSFHRATP